MKLSKFIILDLAFNCRIQKLIYTQCILEKVFIITRITSSVIFVVKKFKVQTRLEYCVKIRFLTMIWLCILWTYVDSKNQEIITQQHSFTKININSAIISSILRILYVSKNLQSKMTNCMTRFLKIWYRRSVTWVKVLRY